MFKMYYINLLIYTPVQRLKGTPRRWRTEKVLRFSRRTSSTISSTGKYFYIYICIYIYKYSTAYPGSSDPFYIVSYYIKWITTSFSHSHLVRKNEEQCRSITVLSIPLCLSLLLTICSGSQSTRLSWYERTRNSSVL